MYFKTIVTILFVVQLIFRYKLTKYSSIGETFWIKSALQCLKKWFLQCEELKKYIPDFIPISADKNTNIDELKDIIFDNLDLVRVYLKPQGRKADMQDPLVIKKGSTVIDACGKLHREFVRNFRHAKIWGTSVKFPGQKVGPDHVLEDEDVLRVILKK